jgi:hypothetical protein
MPHPNFCPPCPPTSVTYVVGPSAPGPVFTFDFEVEIDAADVVVSVLPDGEPDVPSSYIVQVEDVDYDLDRDGQTVAFLSGQDPSTGDRVRIERCTDSTRIVDYQAGSTLTAVTINFENIQQFYLIQELCNEIAQLDEEIGEQVGPPGPQGEPGPPGLDGEPGDMMRVCRIVSKTPEGVGAAGDRFIRYTVQPVIWNNTSLAFEDSGEPPITNVYNRDETRRKNAQHFGILLATDPDTQLDVIVEVLDRAEVVPEGDPETKGPSFKHQLPVTFPVTLEVQNPTASGDAVTQCAYIYDARDLEGNFILNNEAPVNAATQRPATGAMDPATDGIAAWDETTMTMHLLRAFETPQVEECPTQQL